MYKKGLLLVSVILFVLCIFSSFVYATDTIKNGVSGVVNDVVDGVNALGSDVRNGIGNAENGIEDAFRTNDDNTSDQNDNSQNNNTDNNTMDNSVLTAPGDYMTTRTDVDATTAGTTTNDNSTLWIWLIVAIAAIVIIGLVWYYGTQNTTHRDE